MNKTELVYLLQKLHNKNAPVRSKPLGAVGKQGTNMYSPRPGWLRDSSWKLYSDTFMLDERLVGYIKYANVTSRKPNFIEKINIDFLNEMRRRGGKIERI
jgi:hypothetical protein